MTGELSYVGGGEDYESGPRSYTFTVRASDGELSDEAEVTVLVDDVNEPPYFGSGSYTFDLDENADGSTNPVALGRVSATDPEGDALTYAITGGNDHARFSIDGLTGELSYVGGGEDYEALPADKKYMEVTVSATDEHGEQPDVSVIVMVNDLADQPLNAHGFDGFADSVEVFSSTGPEPMGGGGYTIVTEPGAAPLGVPEIGV